MSTPIPVEFVAPPLPSIRGAEGEPIYIPAGQFAASITAGCGVTTQESASSQVNRTLLAFDAATREHAAAVFDWPAGWQTARVSFDWITTTDAGSIVMAAQMACMADGGSADGAWGAAQVVADAAAATGTTRRTAAVAAITPSGTVAAGVLTHVRIYRDAAAAGDDMAGDALIAGVYVTREN